MPEHAVTKVGPDFVQDPYPLYAALREQAPVSRVRMPGGTETWLVTRYEDVRAALADPRLHKDYRELDELNPDSGLRPTSSVDAMRWSMLTRDPPDHTRLRRLVNKAFTPRRMDALRPRIADITAGLLDAMEDAGPDVDLLESLAFPLPVTVICEMLGIPSQEREKFREWTQILIGTPGVAEDVFAAASSAMFEYILRLLAGKGPPPATICCRRLSRRVTRTTGSTRTNCCPTSSCCWSPGTTPPSTSSAPEVSRSSPTPRNSPGSVTTRPCCPRRWRSYSGSPAR